MHEKLVALGRLQQIVETLRGPNGCPWDRVQTLASMSRYLLEESCEVADAVEESSGDASGAVCEELGDVLVNILLAAQIAEDGGLFGIAEVAAGASDKLVRRHPHVFADTRVDSVDQVLTNWNAIKAEEKKSATHSTGAALAGKASRLDGVPRSLPPLEKAFEIGKRASRSGFDWPTAAGALEKVAEELDEVRVRLLASREGQGRGQLEEELGDLLFAVVNVCRKADVRPENALRGTIRKFCQRFRRIEEKIVDLEAASLEAMEAVWQESKTASRTASSGEDA